MLITNSYFFPSPLSPLVTISLSSLGDHCSNDKEPCIWSKDQQTWAAGQLCPRCALAGPSKLRRREEKGENAWQRLYVAHKGWNVYQLPFTGNLCQLLLWSESIQNVSKILGKGKGDSLLTSLMRWAQMKSGGGQVQRLVLAVQLWVWQTSKQSLDRGGKSRAERPHWWLHGG